MAWLRRPADPFREALLMIGVKPGDRVAVIGAADPALAAAIARVTGLNGRLVAAVPDDDTRQAVEEAAADAGALVDVRGWTAGPVTGEADGGVDTVLIDLPDAGPAVPANAATEAARLVRPGGRVLAIERRARRRWLPGRAPADAPPAGEAWRATLASVPMLQRVRILGEVDAAGYVEAVRPRA